MAVVVVVVATVTGVWHELVGCCCEDVDLDSCRMGTFFVDKRVEDVVLLLEGVVVVIWSGTVVVIILLTIFPETTSPIILVLFVPKSVVLGEG